MRTLNNTNEIRNEISSGNVCLKFSAEWCGPCRVLSSIIEEVEGDYNNVKFIEVDVDDVDDSSIIDEYKIKNIPALFFIKNGEVLNKHIGTINHPMLVDELNKY